MKRDLLVRGKPGPLRRLTALSILVAAQVLVLAGVAHAASSVSVANRVLRFTAAAGKANGVTVSLDTAGTSYVVTDTGDTLSAGAGCTLAGAQVRCPATGVGSLSLNLGDGNDWARNTTGAPATMIGAFGNDTMTGGPGADRLRGHDGDDRLFGNEGLDELDGGVGTDTCHLLPSPGANPATDGGTRVNCEVNPY